MLWIALALFTAISVALRDAIVKRSSTALDEYTAVFGIAGTSSLVLTLPYLVLPFPRLGPQLGLALAGSAGPNLIAYVLLAKAVKYSDLSLVAPLMGLTPLFLLVTSPLIVAEVPGPLGVVGVILIVVGTYLLNVRDLRHGPLEPLRALARERGARYMLGVALLWSISANYDKVGIEASSPLAWPLMVNAVIAAVMGVVVFVRARIARGQAGPAGSTPHPGAAVGERTAAQPVPATRAPARRSRRFEGRVLMLGGILNALSVASQMYALTLTLVPYVIAVKRTSVLFSVLLGAIAFGEGRIRERGLGAALIVGGIILFALR